MIITIELNGFKVNLHAPDTLTHLDRNWIETIEDSIVMAKRGPQPMPEGLVLGEMKRWSDLPKDVQEQYRRDRHE